MAEDSGKHTPQPWGAPAWRSKPGQDGALTYIYVLHGWFPQPWRAPAWPSKPGQDSALTYIYVLQNWKHKGLSYGQFYRTLKGGSPRRGKSRGTLEQAVFCSAQDGLINSQAEQKITTNSLENVCFLTKATLTNQTQTKMG